MDRAEERAEDVEAHRMDQIERMDEAAAAREDEPPDVEGHRMD